MVFWRVKQAVCEERAQARLAVISPCALEHLLKIQSGLEVVMPALGALPFH